MNYRNPDPNDDAWSRAAEPYSVPSDSFRASKQRVSARIELHPIRADELPPAQAPEWIWPGYIARRHSTLFTALWKVGKTTLLCHLFRDLQRGGGLVADPLDAPVLVLTEEHLEHWSRRVDEHGMDGRLRFLTPPRSPSVPAWIDYADSVCELVERDGIGLVVFDTLPALWPVRDENDAAGVQMSMDPLRAICKAGAGVLVVHHNRKGDGTEGQAARGSGAIPASVDTIMEFRRFAPDELADRRRVLRAMGRFSDTPPEAVLELRPDGYCVVGDRAHVKQSDRLQIIAGILPEGLPGIDAESVHRLWPTEPKPGQRSVELDLKAGAKSGQWLQTGAGKRGDPFRFHLPTVFDSRSPPL